MNLHLHQAFPDAILWLSLNKGLFAQMFFSVENIVTDTVPTAATNGRKRLFNPEFCAQQSKKQLAGLAAHECLHDMLLHGARRGDRDHSVWNIACDIVNNRCLRASGFDLPDGGCEDKDGRYAGMSEEQIYAALINDAGEQSRLDPNGMAGDIQGGEPTAEEVATVKGKLAAAVEMHGTGSSSTELQGMIDDILHPKEHWSDHLRRYFVSKAFSGCDWQGLCRRSWVNYGLVAPPYQSDVLSTVVISIDQSGSIDGELLSAFAGHVNDILFETRPARVIVQYFDTEVHRTDAFTPDDYPICLERVCGGGTSFVDCCEKAEEHEAVVHLVLTDLEGTLPSGSCVPTLWCCTTDETAPWGETITIAV